MLTNAAISSGPKGEYFLRRRGEYEQRYERYRRTRPSGSRDTPYNILAPARPGNEPKFFDRLRADYGQGSRSFPQLRPRAFLLRRALELTYSSIPTTQGMLLSGGLCVSLQHHRIGCPCRPCPCIAAHLLFAAAW
jgi:hypothetical protein